MEENKNIINGILTRVYKLSIDERIELIQKLASDDISVMINMKIPGDVIKALRGAFSPLGHPAMLQSKNPRATIVANCDF